MKNIILTGSSGMIGNLVLKKCLSSTEVNQVTSIVRRPSGIRHPKLKEIIHDNFRDYSLVEDIFKNQDICFFCIGVYTGAVNKEKFREITVDYTKAFAGVLKEKSPAATFCFLSGQGADLTEKSTIQFARDKGVAENFLMEQHFGKLFIFRPGYIYPVTPRKEPNWMYRIIRPLYKTISLIYPDFGLTSEKLANVMFETGFRGTPKMILENKDIRTAP